MRRGVATDTLREVDDTSIRWVGPAPELTDPVLVVVLDGWIDAAGAAKSALDAIRGDAATPIVEFDDDVYVDFRARRPTMELREGHHSVTTWQRILLSHVRDSTGRDLLLLSGPEPDMAWHRFGRAVTGVALELGVTMMAHLGAYPFAAPHTRPARLSLSTPSEELLTQVPFLRSSIDVPAGAAAVLEREFHERGVPAIGVWAQVPHYVSGMSFPAASLALLEGLREATGVVTDSALLRAESVTIRQRIDRLVAENDDHGRMVGQLEQIYDASDDTVPVEGGGPSLEMRSGDELAAELEAYLRDQD